MVLYFSLSTYEFMDSEESCEEENLMVGHNQSPKMKYMIKCLKKNMFKEKY